MNHNLFSVLTECCPFVLKIHVWLSVEVHNRDFSKLSFKSVVFPSILGTPTGVYCPAQQNSSYHWLAPRRLFSKRAFPIPKSDIEFQAPETWFSWHDQDNCNAVFEYTHKTVLTIIKISSKSLKTFQNLTFCIHLRQSVAVWDKSWRIPNEMLGN